MCLHGVKTGQTLHMKYIKDKVLYEIYIYIYIVTLLAQKTSTFHSRHVTGHGP